MSGARTSMRCLGRRKGMPAYYHHRVSPGAMGGLGRARSAVSLTRRPARREYALREAGGGRARGARTASLMLPPLALKPSIMPPADSAKRDGMWGRLAFSGLFNKRGAGCWAARQRRPSAVLIRRAPR